MRALAWARLLRLSLAPSAAADVAAGLVIGSSGQFPSGPKPWIAIAASLCVYHGGMVLNDWADRADDGRTRPQRPIPSGAISPNEALAVGILLLAGALALAFLIAGTEWMGLIAALVLIYDFVPRHAWIGPLLLGACRALNLAFGLTLGSDVQDVARWISLVHTIWILMLLYGAYVVCASRVARLEDVEDEDAIGSAPRGYLVLAALLLCTVAFVDPIEGEFGLPHPAAFALAVLGAAGLVWRAVSVKRWTRAECGRATGMALRRLLVFTASIALLATQRDDDGWYVAAAILAGFPLSAALRKVIPPT